ncbi:PREDICTED: uncharacterized protein LOC105555754, partial [Vollenhovia emeryi]|uniref:uncharacterized protein LOC105555754 n=1 Tax=Vollenhovia emeryi TaxID=411798 RepID=UPI0005F582C9
MEATLFVILLLVNQGHTLMGYNCDTPFANETVVSLLDTPECLPLQERPTVHNVQVELRFLPRFIDINVISCRVEIMIRRNIDASLGLVNGTIAKVISVVQDISSNHIEKIKLLLPSGSEYLIERVNVKFKVMDRAYVMRKQFPISLSYGITIHKSQGLSLQNAIMDI